MKNKKKVNRRYYLHTKIKKQGYTYYPRRNTIEIPHGTEEISREAEELRESYGYNLQITII